MNYLKQLVLAAATLVLPVVANAQAAFTSKMAHLRAGPARDYPVVAILESGLAVEVQGCMQDYSWCDVIAGEYRGWVYARNIDYSYQGAYVPVIDYGSAIGIGIVTFVIGNYWQEHYIGRPWYRQMPQWSLRPPRANTNPRLPQETVHRGGTQHPVSASRPSQLPPGAGNTPRQPHIETHRERDQHPAPASRPPQLRPGADPAPRQPHVERPEKGQR